MNAILFEILRVKKIMLFVILTLVMLNIMLMALVGSYQDPALSTLQTKWNELRRQLASTGKSDAAALHRQGAADLEKLTARIPLKKEFGRVLGDLLESASTSGVVMGAIAYKPLSIKDENLLSYQLSLKVSGSYAAIKSYVADLQKYPELVVVDSLSLTNSDPFAESLTMDLHLTVYLREKA